MPITKIIICQNDSSIITFPTFIFQCGLPGLTAFWSNWPCCVLAVVWAGGLLSLWGQRDLPVWRDDSGRDRGFWVVLILREARKKRVSVNRSNQKGNNLEQYLSAAFSTDLRFIKKDMWPKQPSVHILQILEAHKGRGCERTWEWRIFYSYFVVILISLINVEDRRIGRHSAVLKIRSFNHSSFNILLTSSETCMDISLHCLSSSFAFDFSWDKWIILLLNLKFCYITDTTGEYRQIHSLLFSKKKIH